MTSIQDFINFTKQNPTANINALNKTAKLQQNSTIQPQKADIVELSSNDSNDNKKSNKKKIALLITGALVALAVYSMKQAEKVHKQFSNIGFGG